jgi:hypothetical protein
VTHLRKAMLEQLQRRNMSKITTRIYLHAVEEFARYFKAPPDRLSLEHVWQWRREGNRIERAGSAPFRAPRPPRGFANRCCRCPTFSRTTSSRRSPVA